MAAWLGSIAAGPEQHRAFKLALSAVPQRSLSQSDGHKSLLGLGTTLRKGDEALPER